MNRRFKSRKKKKKGFVKIGILLILGYFIYSFYYKKVYDDIKRKFKNNELVQDIVELTRVESGVLEKYIDPDFILDAAFLKEETKPKEEVIVNKPEEKIDVYIYSTHESEEYLDDYLNIYNIRPNVKTASFILQDYLEKLGLKCFINQSSVTEVLKENNWPYNRSYDAVRKLIYDDLVNNDYKLIIDLHRDSSLENKTLLEVEGKRYARVLFVVGAEYEGYEHNLAVAQSISKELENIMPSLSRGVIEKKGEGVNGIYNQDIKKNMILIELGGQNNKIEDLNNTLEILSKAIFKYVKENL